MSRLFKADSTQSTQEQSTQDSSPARAFTVIETWQSGQDKGNNPEGFKTRPFAFNRGPWAMIWSLRGESLRIRVRDEKNRSRVLSQEAVNVWQGGQGINYFYEPGTFSLEISASGDWVVKVVAIEELD